MLWFNFFYDLLKCLNLTLKLQINYSPLCKSYTLISINLLSTLYDLKALYPSLAIFYSLSCILKALHSREIFLGQSGGSGAAEKTRFDRYCSL